MLVIRLELLMTKLYEAINDAITPCVLKGHEYSRATRGCSRMGCP